MRSASMYVRIGETEATVIKISRAPSGKLHRVRIKSNKLTPANMGGIAINDAGETLGIVDAVKGHEATIVPLELVRSAAKRVIDRQASVPRPWLGSPWANQSARFRLNAFCEQGWKWIAPACWPASAKEFCSLRLFPAVPLRCAQLRAGRRDSSS